MLIDGSRERDRGNERLSIFLPNLQDDLRNRAPPYSTAGRAGLWGLPARTSDCWRLRVAYLPANPVSIGAGGITWVARRFTPLVLWAAD